MGPVPPPPRQATPGVLQEIGFDQKLGDAIPSTSLQGRGGKDVKLGDYFGRKPVVLSLVYYECPMLCTISLNGLAGALEVLSFVPARSSRSHRELRSKEGRSRRRQEEGLHDRYKRRRPTRAGTS